MPENRKSAAARGWEDILLQQHETYFTMCLPESEAGNIRHFPLAPGVYLSFIRIHTDFWPVPPQEEADHVLLLNYCLHGRCEVTLSNGKLAYLSDGQFALSLQQLAKPCFYPNSFYEGLEVFLDLELLRETPYLLFAELGIDLSELCRRFRLSDSFCLLPLPERTAELLSCLWKLDGTEDISTMKILLAELLLWLSRQERPDSPHVQYFTPAQVQIAKRVQSILTADLSTEHTAKELAGQFGVSETSLKTYFAGVYGENISAYMRRARMRHAAFLLETTQMKISEIALQTGYDNQSKFAAVFKKAYQQSPLEYRRSKWLEKV